MKKKKGEKKRTIKEKELTKQIQFYLKIFNKFLKFNNNLKQFIY